MALPVKLKAIIEGLKFESDEGSSHLNTTTGEVVYMTEEELRAISNLLYDAPCKENKV